ncbi:type II toxin-antitoxin system VapC family toxin [Nocardioides limicola]|uniref:type II toxin-antitoxin system VapC family toxin n=1 Tax=Nocardioides limicola TaxID=2803368 RepID=UPI00193B0457|nr:type II toxin-antitoxin system VapC family toxin [Nocardioides sp. DJM-14]
MLLDTHVLLWLLDDSPRLGPQARRAISTASRVHASAISHTELALKAMLGKLTVPEDLGPRLADQGLRHLAYTEAHAAALTAFPDLTRHDPFDRMLLAQATVEGLRFATADTRLLSLDLRWVVDARS